MNSLIYEDIDCEINKAFSMKVGTLVVVIGASSHPVELGINDDVKCLLVIQSFICTK
jgi:hypothetical protein